MKIKKVLALVAVCIGVSAGGQTVFVVPPETSGVDPAYPFDTWGHAATSIHDAVGAALASGATQVFVSNGLYNITNEIVLNNALYLRSWNDGALDQTNTIINAGGVHRGFFVSNAVLEGVLISNAATEGVSVYNGVVRHCDVAYTIAGRSALVGPGGVLEDSVLRNADDTIAAPGAGVRIDAGIVRRCSIIRNMLLNHNGGGVYITAGGQLLDSSIVSNQCIGTKNGWGGGVFVSALGIVSNCLVQANRTLGHNSGVYMSGGEGGNIVVDKCVVVDNVVTGVDHGGGFYMNGGVLRNSLIARNSALRFGGGVYVSDVSNLVENCTIVSNYAAQRGGGMYGPSSVASNVSFINNIIYFNDSPSGSNLYNYTTVNWINNCTAPSVDAYGSGNITDEPGFVSFAPDMAATDYNLRLTPDSRCINAGTNQPSMSAAVDLDGRTRIDRFSRLVDMGCYEHVPPGTLFGLR